jgi:tetratricopeptide (TPR) repeat protein
MQGKSHNSAQAEPGSCLSDHQLYRYLERLVTADERHTIESHLSSCSECLSSFAALARSVHAPMSETEKIALARLAKRAPQEQVQNILDYVADDRMIAAEADSKKKELPTPDFSLWRRLSSIVFGAAMRRGHRIPAWKLGFVFVAVLALMSGSYFGISYYNAASRIQQAESLLKNNYRVFFEETPRLAGGYETKGIGVLMGEENSTSYLQQAASLAEAALKGGWKSDAAKQLLAQVFIISQDYDKADSIFKLIKTDAARSATALNDLGVLNYQKKNWESAASYFAAAIQTAPQLEEARYNLALAKAKLGAIDETIAILDEYLKLETDDGWKAAAEEFQKKLKAERS